MNLVFLYLVFWSILCLLCFYVMDIKEKRVFILGLFPPVFLVMWFCFFVYLFIKISNKQSEEEAVYRQLFDSLTGFNLSPNDFLFLSNNSEYKNREQLLELIKIGKKII